MKILFKLVFIPCLLVLLAIGAYADSKEDADDKPVLLTASKFEGDKMSQISLLFSDLPSYRVKSSGQRVDLIIRDTKIDPAFKELSEDETLVKMSSENALDETIISFFWRRPPDQVDTSFKICSSTENEASAGTNHLNTLTLNIHWHSTPMEATTEQKSLARPAIAIKLEGDIQSGSNRATATRTVSSVYSGDWKAFIEEYEVAAHVPPNIQYTLPPFPSFDLFQPAETVYDLEQPEMAVYLNAIALGKTKDWQMAENLLRQDLIKQEARTSSKKLRLLYGEILIRSRKYSKARNVLKTLVNDKLPLPENICARYLTIVAQASSGAPYDAAYELNLLRQDMVPRAAPLLPYYQLLDTEIALSIGRFDQALKFIATENNIHSGSLGEKYKLRHADALAANGQKDKAYDLYQELIKKHEIVKDQPFSLIHLTDILYHQKEYESSLYYSVELASCLYNYPGRDIALFIAAMSQYKSGKKTESLLLLEDIINNFPNSEGSFRARLKLNDLLVLSTIAQKNSPKRQETNTVPSKVDNDATNDAIALKAAEKNSTTHKEKEGTSEKGSESPFNELDPAQIYVEISKSAPLSALREEAAFKQALVSYLNNKVLETTELLQDFLRTNSNGLLQKEAAALMVEILPKAIETRIEKKDYIKALVLAEQNREMLVSGHINSDFLAELGLAFAGLWFWNRAIRVYLYMLDISKGKAEEEVVYLPLIKSYYENDEHSQVEKYAATYSKHYPKGKDLAEIYHLRLNSLKKSDQVELAVNLLRKENFPDTRELNADAGRLFFEAGEYDAAGKFLEKAIGHDLWEASSEEIVLLAESLFRGGNGQKALPLYKQLSRDKIYSDQANYRTAQIQIKSDNEARGLKVLQTLVEKGNSPLWRKMATETLSIEQM